MQKVTEKRIGLASLLRSRGGLREQLVSRFQYLIPEFQIPTWVTLKLDVFGNDLAKFSVSFPPEATASARDAATAYELYDNLSYLFGKGYFATHADGSEGMVWYVPRSVAGPRLWRLANGH